jgi:hypothetical protein
MQHDTLVDLFEIVPSAFSDAPLRAQYRPRQRTLVDPYELGAAPTSYRSKQQTLVEPFERRTRPRRAGR